MKHAHEQMKSGHCAQCGTVRSKVGNSKGYFGCMALLLAPFTLGLSLLLFFMPRAWRCTACGSTRISKVE